MSDLLTQLGLTGATEGGNVPFGDKAVDLPEEQLLVFMARLRTALGSAKSRKTNLNTQAENYRRLIDVEPKQQVPYEDAPNITLPIIRSKRDGVIAHLADAVDVDPLFSARPLTAEASTISAAYEALMGRENSMAGTREVLLRAVGEAVDVGTGILGWSLARNESRELVIQERLVPFEMFFVYPRGVPDLTNAATFEAIRLPAFELERMMDEGLVDREVASDLLNLNPDDDNPDTNKRPSSGIGQQLHHEKRDSTSDDVGDVEHQPIELWEAYIRRKGVLFQVLFSESHPRPLIARKAWTQDIINAPPYEVFRIMVDSNQLWGFPMARLLHAMQSMADFSANTRIAYNQFALAPVIAGNPLNPFVRALQESGGVKPGAILESIMPIGDALQVVQFPKPDLTLEEMNLSQRYADLATFTDFQIQGAPFAAGRRTATEVRTSFNVGTLKIRHMLRVLRDDLARFAKKKWAMIDAFKVRPAGVVRVHRETEQFVIASQELNSRDVQDFLQEFILSRGALDPTELQSSLPEIAQIMKTLEATGGIIPSTSRSDIEWVANGSDVIPDKMAELQKMTQFGQFLPLLAQAQQDHRVWYFLKTVLQLMGRRDWKDFILDDPLTKNDAAVAMMQQQGQGQSPEGGNQIGADMGMGVPQ